MLPKETLITDALLPVQPEDQMQNTLSRKRIFLEQLSFVISQRPLQKMIESLRISNEDFRSLCKGALELRRSPKIELLETDLATNQKFEEFSFINQASKQLYEVISDSCQQHEEHLTCFCTEVDQVFTPTGTVAQVKFRLGLVHSQSKTSPCWQNLAWFEIESASSDYEYSDGRVHETQQSSNFLGSLKSSAFDQSTARLKRTRRHPVPRSVIGGATSPGQSNIGPPSQTQDESINKDICKFIELDIKQPEKPSICCGFLKPSGSYKNRLYRVALQDCSMQSEAVSLKDLISQNRDGIFGRISPYDRVRLAQKLASAVLQFYSTPWLHGSLSSKDILFFGIHLVDVPKLTPPHFEVKIYSSKAKGKAAGSAFSTIKETINSILVNLGIVLLEIAHRSTCEELVRTLIASLPTGDRRSQKPIEELLASVPRHSDMGGSYHKIVNDILHGHICASEALGEGQLPSIIHQRVVIPLADVVHQVRTFHGG